MYDIYFLIVCGLDINYANTCILFVDFNLLYNKYCMWVVFSYTINFVCGFGINQNNHLIFYLLLLLTFYSSDTIYWSYSLLK